MQESTAIWYFKQDYKEWHIGQWNRQEKPEIEPIRINWKWIIVLNLRAKTIKLHEENRRKSL